MIKHGLSKHPLYTVWNGMKSRCYSITHKGYKNYGGRGITICDEWVMNFNSFYEWAIKNGWQKGLQVDRINNDLGYTPFNCRIVTKTENNNNRRTTIHITYNKKVKLLTEWAKELNLDYSNLRKKIVDTKLPPEVAFNVCKIRKGELFELNGDLKTLTDWCKEYNTNLKRVWNRIYIKKWSLEDALSKPIYTHLTQKK